MPFFIEMLTLVHEWKLSPLFGNEGQPQICEKKPLPALKQTLLPEFRDYIFTAVG